MIYTGTTLTNTEAHAMHAKCGRSQGRNTLRRRTFAPAPAGPLPGTALWPIPTAPEAITNRSYLRTVGLTWKYTLTAGNRTAWAALATTVTPKNNDGSPIAPGGRSLFMWYCMTNIFTGWYGSFVLPAFDPASHTSPPALWNPPADPGPPASFNIYSNLGGQIYFSTPYTQTARACVALLPSWRQHGGRFAGNPSQRTLALQLTWGVPHFTLVIQWYGMGFFPDTYDQHGKTIIIRLLSDPPNSVPSDPFSYVLPI